jgi:hypothetical protein
MTPEGALARAMERLSSERTGIACRLVAPDPRWADIGAIGGFGLRAECYDVQLNVYLFKEWGEGRQRAAAVRASAEAPEREVIVGVSGPLLFLGAAQRGDEGTHFALNDLCSAVSGQE